MCVLDRLPDSSCFVYHIYIYITICTGNLTVRNQDNPGVHSRIVTYTCNTHTYGIYRPYFCIIHALVIQWRKLGRNPNAILMWDIYISSFNIYILPWEKQREHSSSTKVRHFEEWAACYCWIHILLLLFTAGHYSLKAQDKSGYFKDETLFVVRIWKDYCKCFVDACQRYDWFWCVRQGVWYGYWRGYDTSKYKLLAGLRSTIGGVKTPPSTSRFPIGSSKQCSAPWSTVQWTLRRPVAVNKAFQKVT